MQISFLQSVGCDRTWCCDHLTCTRIHSTPWCTRSGICLAIVCLSSRCECRRGAGVHEDVYVHSPLQSQICVQDCSPSHCLVPCRRHRTLPSLLSLLCHLAPSYDSARLDLVPRPAVIVCVSVVTMKSLSGCKRRTRGANPVFVFSHASRR